MHERCGWGSRLEKSHAMIEIRRLDPEKDRNLYEEAFEWERNYPRWLRDAEKACSVPLPEFLEKADARADIGIFAPEFIGMVSIISRGVKVFEGHVWAKRCTNLGMLAEGVGSVVQSLIVDLEMRAGFVWVAKSNRPIRKLCGIIGLLPDGAEVVDGESHGKPIIWQRLSLIT